MAVCRRCGRDVGLVAGAINFNRQTSRCGKCENETNQALGRFRMAFLNYCQDGILTSDEWQMLAAGATSEGLDKQEALNFIRGDALHFLERSVTFAAADGEITDQEANNIIYLKILLGVPDSQFQPLYQRIEQIRTLTNIRKGKLPVVHTNIRLDFEEQCHMVMNAAYHKVTAKTITQIPGQLVASSKRLRFISTSFGTELLWSNVMRVTVQGNGIYLELQRKTGNGYYAVPDPWYAEALIDTLVRMYKREVLAFNPFADPRRIPQEVKIAVWERDRGRCVECGLGGFGASLEYDHIIPVSKGGASTIGNIQLLCRKCNLKKGNRI